MKHLSQAEFVDLIESQSPLPAARAQHAEECERCRTEAESLRAMRLVASRDAMPEPSPLFWDHFSARVAEQVRNRTRPVCTSGRLEGEPLRDVGRGRDDCCNADHDRLVASHASCARAAHARPNRCGLAGARRGSG